MYLLLLVSQLTPNQSELIIPPPVPGYHAQPIPSVPWVPHDPGFFPHGPPLPYYIPPGGPWGIGNSWQRRAPSISHAYTTAEPAQLPPPKEKEEGDLPPPRKENDNGNKDAQNKEVSNKEPEKGSPNQGRIVIEIPEKSTLYVNNLQVHMPKPQGTLLTADLEPGKKYVYDLKVELLRDGKTVTQNRKVSISSGEAVFVMFADPNEVQTIEKLP